MQSFDFSVTLFVQNVCLVSIALLVLGSKAMKAPAYILCFLIFSSFFSYFIGRDPTSSYDFRNYANYLRITVEEIPFLVLGGKIGPVYATLFGFMDDFQAFLVVQYCIYFLGIIYALNKHPAGLALILSVFSVETQVLLRFIPAIIIAVTSVSVDYPLGRSWVDKVFLLFAFLLYPPVLFLAVFAFSIKALQSFSIQKGIQVMLILTIFMITPVGRYYAAAVVESLSPRVSFTSLVVLLISLFVRRKLYIGDLIIAAITATSSNLARMAPAQLTARLTFSYGDYLRFVLIIFLILLVKFLVYI